MIILLFIIAIGSGLLCKYVAESKNMDGMQWFFIGLVLPLFALIALVAIPAKAPPDEIQTKREQDDRDVRELIQRLRKP